MQRKPSVTLRVLAVAGAVFVVVLAGRLWSGGYLARDAVWRYPAAGRRADVDALFLSGDSGLRVGAGPYIARSLAARGVETTGIATPTLFRFPADRARIDAVIAGLVAAVERRADGRPLVVIGQSYGADVLQTGLADLPRPLRAQIAAVVLIVPGTGVYYRADPLGWAYSFAPDSRALDTVPRIDWAPLTCIAGREETDDVCPLLHMPNAHVVMLPGDHYLSHDHPRVLAAVLPAVERAARR